MLVAGSGHTSACHMLVNGQPGLRGATEDEGERAQVVGEDA